MTTEDQDAHELPVIPPRHFSGKVHVLVWVLGFLGSFALAIGLIYWLLSRQGATLVNAFGRSAGLQVSEVRTFWKKNNRIELDGFLWEQDGSNLEVGKLSILLNTEKITDPKLSSLKLEHPKFVLHQISSEVQSKEKSQVSVRQELPDVEIDSGSLAVEIADWPQFRGKISGTMKNGVVEGDQLTEGQASIFLSDIELDSPLASQGEITARWLQVESLMAKLKFQEERLIVTELEVIAPKLTISPSVLKSIDGLLRGGDVEPSESPIAWAVERMVFRDVAICLHDFADYLPIPPPDLALKADIEIRDLQGQGSEISPSKGRQLLTIREIRLDGGESPTLENGPVLASIERIEIEWTMHGVLEEGTIDRLEVVGPNLKFDRETYQRFDPWWRAVITGNGNEKFSLPTDESRSAQGTPKKYYQIQDLSVIDGTVKFDLRGEDPRLPFGSARWSLTTKEGEGEQSYQLILDEVECHSGAIRPRKIASVKRAVLDVSPKNLQLNNRLDRAEIAHAIVTIGPEIDDLASYFSNWGASPGEPPKQKSESVPVIAPTSEKQWTLGELTFRESRIELENVAPGLSYVPISLTTTIEDIPLEGRTEGDERIQKIELGRIGLKSLNNSMVEIASLDSIFLYFSLAGLFRNEVERVEIVTPKLFVGEHLFWYIDGYRNNIDQAALELGFTIPRVEEGKLEKSRDVSSEDGRIALLEEALKAEVISNWKIREIKLFNGQLILAPRGVAIGAIPLPFSTETNFEKGEIDLSLEIPPGDYSFPSIGLSLKRLQGKAEFNYPLKKVDNNLVQTFQADLLQFKRDYIADGITLSVTYNSELIHVELWARAYEGDINGEFNLYINDGETYAWDGWLSAVNMDTQKFSQVLAPDVFEFSGKLDAQIVVEGKGLSLGKAEGELKMGKGKLTINALSRIAEEFPETWSAWQKTIGESVVDIFINYPFDFGSARLNLKDWNGTAQLLFDGPVGKRELNFLLSGDSDLSSMLQEIMGSFGE